MQIMTVQNQENILHSKYGVMMKTVISLMIALIFSYGITAAQAQNLLNKPEHVAYDSLHQRYLVSNYGNGKIVSIDHSGNQTAIIEGLTGCLGIHIVDTTIFITAGASIHLYSLNSHAFIQTLSPNVSNWIDGMTDDGAGNLYVAENAGKIHQIRLSDFHDTIIVGSGLPLYPQDLTYDPLEHRLILVCWQTNSPITAISLHDHTVSSLISTTPGQFDGIMRLENGDLYVSTWASGGKILKWEYPYTSGAITFSTGHAGPAGLGFNPSNNILAVPNFSAHSISYLNTALNAGDEKSAINHDFILQQNYPNPFNPSTTISFEIAEPGYVSLNIYNLLGQEVAGLIHRKMNAGRYSVIWNAERFAGGIYFYRLDAIIHDKRHSQIRKMVLIK